MNYFGLAQQAVDWIEEHLYEPIKAENVACVFDCSDAYFRYVFCTVVGLSVKRYVRQRRLSLAARELALTSCKVLEVALRYHYDSPEAFARAFKRFHGVSPKDCRKTGVYKYLDKALSLYQKANGEKIMAVHAAKDATYLYLNGDTDRYSAYYFEQAAQYVTLPSTGNRSWFAAAGWVVVLGTNMSSSTAVVAQRLFRVHRTAFFECNGIRLPAGEDAATLPHTFLHLADRGVKGVAQVGWYFPQEGQTLSVTRKDTSNHKKGSPFEKSTFTRVCLCHGGHYEYAVLPNYSRGAAERFAARQAGPHPHYRVLHCEAHLHAVYCHDTRKLMVNQFEDTPVCVKSPETGIVYEISGAATVVVHEHVNGRISLESRPSYRADALSVTVFGRRGTCVSRGANRAVVTQCGENMVVSVAEQWNRPHPSGVGTVLLATVPAGEKIPIPKAVKRFAVVGTDAFSATLSWEPAEENPGYELLQYLVSYTAFGTERYLRVPGDRHSLRIFPLAEGTDYTFTVIPQNLGQGSAAKTATAHTAALPRNLLPPLPLSGFVFNGHGQPGNTCQLIQDGLGQALELHSAQAHTVAEAVFPLTPITGGLVAFGCFVRTPYSDNWRQDFNSISLLGTVNGHNVRVVTVMSEYGCWRYDIQRNFTPHRVYNDVNTRIGNAVEVTLQKWNEIRMLVDFNRKRATVLVNGQVMVYDEPFRYRTAAVSDDAYTAITGMGLLTRHGGPGTLRVRGAYVYGIPQSSVG